MQPGLVGNEVRPEKALGIRFQLTFPPLGPSGLFSLSCSPAFLYLDCLCFKVIIPTPNVLCNLNTASHFVQILESEA